MPAVLVERGDLGRIKLIGADGIYSIIDDVSDEDIGKFMRGILPSDSYDFRGSLEVTTGVIIKTDDDLIKALGMFGKTLAYDFLGYYAFGSTESLRGAIENAEFEKDAVPVKVRGEEFILFLGFMGDAAALLVEYKVLCDTRVSR